MRRAPFQSFRVLTALSLLFLPNWLAAREAASADILREDLHQFLIFSADAPPDQSYPLLREWAERGEFAVNALEGILDAGISHHQPDISYMTCELAGRLGDPRLLSGLEPLLKAQDWVTRSACGEAYARILVQHPERNEERGQLRRLILVDASCIVQRNLAMAYSPADDPALRSFLEQLLSSEKACEQEVGIRGLAQTQREIPRVGEAFLRILLDEKADLRVRAAAADALGQLAYQPARQHLLAIASLEEDPGMNLIHMAMGALGSVGLPEDIPFLKGCIARDPYDGVGIQAVQSRKAIKGIRQRFPNAAD